MSDRERREETCPDCQATAENWDSRVTGIGKDPDTGAMYATVTWHAEDCPTYTVQQILAEDSVRRTKERSEWGRKAFPVAHERLLRAVGRGSFDESAMPFVEALVELVEAQGEDLGRIVLPERWAEILDRHFPPGEEPTT